MMTKEIIFCLPAFSTMYFHHGFFLDRVKCFSHSYTSKLSDVILEALKMKVAYDARYSRFGQPNRPCMRLVEPADFIVRDWSNLEAGAGRFYDKSGLRLVFYQHYPSEQNKQARLNCTLEFST